MKPSRLSLAIATGAVTVPDQGRIAIFRPRAGHDLGKLPKDRISVIQGFKPDFEAFVAVGYDTQVSTKNGFGAAIIFLPRAKAEARALLAKASQTVAGGLIIVDGQKTDGIDSIYKDCKRRGADVGPTFSKSHGKVFAVTGGDFWDWAAEKNISQLEGGFKTAPGVFSADGVDRGSALLGSALPEKMTGRVADLGAGWGYLAKCVLEREDVRECHLIEAEHAALECAQENIMDPRAHFVWADVTNWRPGPVFDIAVSNPPFHTGRTAEPALGEAFIKSAAAALKPSGVLWLVANRHLPYEGALKAAFKSVVEIAGDTSFKVFCASKPQKKAG